MNITVHTAVLPNPVSRRLL